VENADQGFAGLQNVLLDLTGGVVGEGTDPAPVSAGRPIKVGPLVATKKWVDLDKIGLPDSGKSYLTLDPKLFVAQTDAGQQFSNSPPASAPLPPYPQNALLPSVVDQFGTPILAWVADESILPAPANQPSNFAATTAPNNATGAGARFYWASNAAFLKATSLGKKGRNQTTTNPADHSLLGGGVDPTLIPFTLEGMLGNPNYGRVTDPTGATLPVSPAAARAPLTLQSAGVDGYYLRRSTRQAALKSLGGTAFPGDYEDALKYAWNFCTANSTTPAPIANGFMDDQGKPTRHDVLTPFDDLFSYSGN